MTNIEKISFWSIEFGRFQLFSCGLSLSASWNCCMSENLSAPPGLSSLFRCSCISTSVSSVSSQRFRSSRPSHSLFLVRLHHKSGKKPICKFDWHWFFILFLCIFYLPEHFWVCFRKFYQYGNFWTFGYASKIFRCNP